MKKDLILKIYPDNEPFDPRKDSDSLGTMVCWHRNYDLGDVQADCTVQDYIYGLVEDKFHDGEDEVPLEEINEVFEQSFLSLPLYLYDHSGITMRTGPFNCPWDSGQVGFIYVSHEKIKQEYTGTPFEETLKLAREVLETEVQVYDAYLTGDVFGYELVREEDEDDILDSCWGIIALEKGNERYLQFIADGDRKRVKEIRFMSTVLRTVTSYTTDYVEVL